MKLDGKTIQSAIMQIIEEYKFDPHQILDIVKTWIKSAFRKDYMDWDKKSSVQVTIDKDGNIKIYREYIIVEEIEDKSRDIELSEAKKIKKDVKLWENLLIDITPESLEFSRIAVQAAAQTIKQNLKKIERERFFEKFQDKQWELLKAKILKSIWDNILLDIDWTSVILSPEWQIPNRVYNVWEEIIVLLKQISKWTWWIVLDITQSSDDFIYAVLSNQVPEIVEWKVIVKKIARNPWKRTKILVSTDDDRIDPVWVFVWQYWDRITNILDLLDWERIDFIEENEDHKQMISQALKPSRIKSIQIEWKKAFVKVDDDQKALAIWKWAINIKLARKITWYNIEII